MKIWLLEPINGDEGAWDPWYDACFGMVIAAETEIEARAIAYDNAAAEGNNVWLQDNQTSCKELNPQEKGLILKDEHWA